VIFLDIGKILEKGVLESSVCDTGVYRFHNFHIFKQFPFQIPYNLAHFFQFSITFNNSFLPLQFPYPSMFATCYTFPKTLLSIRSSSLLLSLWVHVVLYSGEFLTKTTAAPSQEVVEGGS
jgi:hypothetical protein